MIIRPTIFSDTPWISQSLTNLWGSTKLVTRGKLIDLTSLNGFIAEEEGRRVGLITYKIGGEECEITSINSLTPGKGIGSALLEEVEKEAKEKRCQKLIVCTTNDNINAQKFYEKRGFVVTQIRKNIMKEYRKLKPEIPIIGNDGIPLMDEIELHKVN